MAAASAIAWRAFADARVRTISFALLFAFSAVIQATAYREGYPTLADRRDFARSVGENDAARLLYGTPHDLGSPVAQALRSERGALVAWLIGVGAFALLMGVLSDAVTPDVISENVQRQLEKLGTGSIVTPSGWLGFSFIFFMLAVSLFCCMQIAAIRDEEAEQRLETMLALPVGRRGWLAGRLLLAAAGAAAVALAAGVLAWAGAAAQGADVSLPEMLGAGVNTLPPALLFLALGALAYALAPRASTVIAYSLVGLAFVWELFGALLEVPDWLLALSPFHDVGLVPAEPFEATAAVVMLAAALGAAVAAIWVFERRDLAAA